MVNRHVIPKLNYSFDALEPWIDAKTMEIHYGKHHQAYCDKLNSALEKHPELFEMKVEELLRDLSAVPEDIRTSVKNNGGGFVNHSFFWEILGKNSRLGREILRRIELDFESFDNFKKLFSEAAVNRFGSGWVWLVWDKNRLNILSTANQDSPLTEHKVPLLCIDLWEHSYYIKYEWRRSEYIGAFFNVINWDKVNELFEKFVR